MGHCGAAVWLQEEAPPGGATWGCHLLRVLGGPEGAPPASPLDLLDPLLGKPGHALLDLAAATVNARVDSQGARLKLELARSLLEVGTLVFAGVACGRNVNVCVRVCVRVLACVCARVCMLAYVCACVRMERG